MGVPQLLIIALGFLSLGIDIARHGQPKNDKYNGVIGCISLAIFWTILYYGGFWS